MAHIDTRETVQSGRKFIKKAMKLPMLEPEKEGIAFALLANNQVVTAIDAAHQINNILRFKPRLLVKVQDEIPVSLEE